jgi:hypothetical protein
VLGLAEAIAVGVPCYDMYFDKSGRIVDALGELAE